MSCKRKLCKGFLRTTARVELPLIDMGRAGLEGGRMVMESSLKQLLRVSTALPGKETGGPEEQVVEGGHIW